MGPECWRAASRPALAIRLVRADELPRRVARLRAPHVEPWVENIAVMSVSDAIPDLPSMTPDLADAFAAIALGHVTREYPNKLDHVLAGPQDARTPRDLHPVFYGSFDWHSCVHGYWMLAHLLPALSRQCRTPPRSARCSTRTWSPERIAGECAYLDSLPDAWVRAALWLGLAAEAGGGTGVCMTRRRARRWSAALEPLARIFAARFMAFLPLAHLPDPRRRAYQHRLRGSAGAGLPGSRRCARC